MLRFFRENLPHLKPKQEIRTEKVVHTSTINESTSSFKPEPVRPGETRIFHFEPVLQEVLFDDGGIQVYKDRDGVLLSEVARSDYGKICPASISIGKEKSVLTFALSPIDEGRFNRNPESIHVVKLTFSGSLLSVTESEKRDEVEVSYNGVHRETIARSYKALKIDDIPLDQILARHQYLPNAKQFLDYYKNEFSRPEERQTWHAAAKHGKK